MLSDAVKLEKVKIFNPGERPFGFQLEGSPGRDDSQAESIVLEPNGDVTVTREKGDREKMRFSRYLLIRYTEAE